MDGSRVLEVFLGVLLALVLVLALMKALGFL
jgi:hypothetical protein